MRMDGNGHEPDEIVCWIQNAKRRETLCEKGRTRGGFIDREFITWI